MSSSDYDHRRNKEWLGYLQPMGLVVSPPALAEALAFPNANIIPEHNRFLECVEEVSVPGKDEKAPAITDFPRFCSHVLGWRPSDLVGSKEGGPLPDSLESVLTDYNETLRPTYAVKQPESKPEGRSSWMLLAKVLPNGTNLDTVVESDSHHWQANPQARFERLLRDTQVPVGLLFNGTNLRLVYAPKGESSGHLTFPVRAMTEVAGRPIFAALVMLLGEDRLFTLPDGQRLPEILEKSRKYQNLVSTKLAEQVLAALYELLRGFQAADDQKKGELLRQVLQDDPNQVYAGLLTVLLRLVFLLYAEDRGLMSDPQDELYQNYYAIAGLFERLRADAGRHTDTMDHRFGSWPQLLALFRMVHDGARHDRFAIPARKGYLFDPDKYPFLEGRAPGQPSFAPIADEDGKQPSRTRRGRITVDPPHVSDGVVFRVLQNLLILDGERLSYRTLDVEQIGSVYETIMGFILEVAQGRSIAIKPTKPHGAPTTINLEELLAVKPADRAKWLKEQSDQAVTGQAAAALKEAATPDDAVAALERKVAFAATPRVVPAGAMVLQPSEERRRSGSHYTPRSLTEPIVETTFRPILERLGQDPLPLGEGARRAGEGSPTPAQILDLKVCDPAMGSGAFLVAVCRFLAELLVRAWHAHKCLPKDIPPDEDEILHARRIVAQRCLYGVDKNPMAVDLAKLSLWLATLAKDHPFTFLDHALRCGDSLVGLSRTQIESFHWKPEKQRDFARGLIEGKIRRAVEGRLKIQNASEFEPYLKLDQELALVEEALKPLRFYGDLVVAAFFAGSNDKQRKDRLDELTETLAAHLTNPDFLNRYPALVSAQDQLRSGEKSVTPFHWEIEFPEVFGRENPGFDALVGNPPFKGGARISTTQGMSYFGFLTHLYYPAGHQCDLVGYFFRRSYDLLCQKGALGLIATNTIAQGDTRKGALVPILINGGNIYNAIRRLKWPGLAAVIVSPVHISKQVTVLPATLDGKSVQRISAYLVQGTTDEDPMPLSSSLYFSKGCQIYGQGFLFDDHDSNATPLTEMVRILAEHPECRERVCPYIGGDELNSDPRQSHHRYAIYLSDIKSSADLDRWPELRRIVESKVKPERELLGSNPNNIPLKRRWWAYQAHRPDLYQALGSMDRALCIARVSQHLAFAFLPSAMIHSEQLVLIADDSHATFSVLQSRMHESWARFFASSLEDRLRYTPSDCFETFAFPENFEANPTLESAGQAYYEFRAALMVRNNEGLTKTYNRFHDPDERSPDILKLRELHAAMDRAVLDAYGWTDLKPTCEFLLDYEEDEDDELTTGNSQLTTRRSRKKPWRYRWPDDFRDEVLARLLELNRQRAEQERLSGAAAEASRGKAGKKSTAGRKVARKNPDQPEFFES